LLGRHIDLMLLTYVAFLPYIKSGEVRILVAASSMPSSSIPSFAEAGYPQVALLPRNTGGYVSAKIPKPIYEKLVLAFKRAANNPELIKKLEDNRDRSSLYKSR